MDLIKNLINNFNLNYLINILKLFKLSKHLNVNYFKLSTGQKQKFYSVLTILLNKSIWLLDEPFIGLDKKSILLLKYIINKHIRSGGTVIITSHININFKNALQIYL